MIDEGTFACVKLTFVCGTGIRKKLTIVGAINRHCLEHKIGVDFTLNVCQTKVLKLRTHLCCFLLFQCSLGGRMHDSRQNLFDALSDGGCFYFLSKQTNKELCKKNCHTWMSL